MAKLDTGAAPTDGSVNKAREDWPATGRNEEQAHNLIAQCVRALIADLCQQSDWGHPG